MSCGALGAGDPRAFRVCGLLGPTSPHPHPPSATTSKELREDLLISPCRNRCSCQGSDRCPPNLDLPGLGASAGWPELGTDAGVGRRSAVGAAVCAPTHPTPAALSPLRVGFLRHPVVSAGSRHLGSLVALLFGLHLPFSLTLDFSISRSCVWSFGGPFPFLPKV